MSGLPPAGVRTVVRESMAIAEGLRLLTPEQMEAMREYTRLRMEGPSPWLFGVEPLPFDDFFFALDGRRMTARQHQVLEETGCLRAAHIFSERRTVQEFDLVWGKGSGKGYWSAKFIAWVCLIVNSMAGFPAERFGPPSDPLAPESTLVCINCAPDADLAKNVFFKYLKQFLKHPIFAPFQPKILEDEVRFYRPGLGGIPYECLVVYSKHSKASGLDGFNLLTWVMDEADAFLMTEERDAAKEIYDIFRSSASTRTGMGWLGFCISYPRTEDGFQLERYNRAKADMAENGKKSRYFADMAATWDVRPGVTKENTPSIADDYKYDPRGARAKYECLPMKVDEAFFEFSARITEAIKPNLLPCAVWHPCITRKGTESGDIAEYVSVVVEETMREPGRTYYLGGDGGISGDLFALSVWSRADSTAGATWLCPWCPRERPDLLKAAHYEQQADGAGHLASVGEQPECGGGCGTRANGYWKRDKVHFDVGGWYRRVAGNGEGYDMIPCTRTLEDGTLERVFVTVPRVREDLIITWMPEHKTTPAGTDRTVDLESVEAACVALIQGLGVKIARFDPYQTASMAQKLKGLSGCNSDTIGFDNAAQYTRARIIKTVLYAGLLTLMPHQMPETPGALVDETPNLIKSPGGVWVVNHHGEKRRDREWQQLQRKGVKIDHPKRKGSKDIYDAESVAAFLAVTDDTELLKFDWIN